MPRSLGGQKHSPETLRTTRRGLVRSDIMSNFKRYPPNVPPMLSKYKSPFWSKAVEAAVVNLPIFSIFAILRYFVQRIGKIVPIFLISPKVGLALNQK